MLPWRKRIGLPLGPALMLTTLLVPDPGLGVDAWRVAGLAAWMSAWWITEALPLGVTGLLPLVVLPLATPTSESQVARDFANPVLFLFLGGFWLAAGVERWRLHERIAYTLSLRVGMTPARIVGGFMLATAFLSMWMSNTASVLLMLPMGVSMVALMEAHPEQQRFGRLLMLAIAYAATIGGLATLIGTPPNAFLAGFARDRLAESISFGAWFLWMLPLTAIGLVAAWALLTQVLFRIRTGPLPGGEALVQERLERLGPLSTPEKRVAAVFALVAVGWLASPLAEGRIPWPGDATWAVLGAMALFLLPSGEGRPLLTLPEARKVPWDVLLLFGGGLALAAAMDRTGLAAWLGDRLVAVGGGNVVVLVVGASLLALLMTEFMSNTASAAILLPILASVATATGTEPLLLLVPATLMATCGFMMPAGTPPNALAVSTDRVDAPTMVRTGIWLNLLFLLLVVPWAFLLDALVW